MVAGARPYTGRRRRRTFRAGCAMLLLYALTAVVLGVRRHITPPLQFVAARTSTRCRFLLGTPLLVIPGNPTEIRAPGAALPPDPGRSCAAPAGASSSPRTRTCRGRHSVTTCQRTSPRQSVSLASSRLGSAQGSTGARRFYGGPRGRARSTRRTSRVLTAPTRVSSDPPAAMADARAELCSTAASSSRTRSASDS